MYYNPLVYNLEMLEIQFNYLFFEILQIYVITIHI